MINFKNMKSELTVKIIEPKFERENLDMFLLYYNAKTNKSTDEMKLKDEWMNHHNLHSLPRFSNDDADTIIKNTKKALKKVADMYGSESVREFMLDREELTGADFDEYNIINEYAYTFDEILKLLKY